VREILLDSASLKQGELFATNDMRGLWFTTVTMNSIGYLLECVSV
jgi:hypothetical protein